MPNISEYPGPILTYFAGLIVVFFWVDYPNIHLATAQGTLLWQTVKFFGGYMQKSSGTLLWHSTSATTDLTMVKPLQKIKWQ